MKNIRLGIIGLGARGYGMLKNNFLNFDSVEFTALCDSYSDRIDRAYEEIIKRRPEAKKPFMTVDYKELLERADVDAVYISTSWEYHIEISIAAMKAGKAVAMEVGGAYSVDECFELVRTYEKTGTPLMFMENCCYDRAELLVTALARAGKLGTVVHCSGAYAHDLREEILSGNINRHYRLRNYISRNCDNYPTHELGPIARLLNINRGNRMLSLVSVSSKAAGLEEFARENGYAEKDPSLSGVRFAQGDIVTTIIKCAGGETVTLRLDTTLPRSYNRELTVRGTKGMYEMATNTVFLDGEEEYWEPAKYYAEAINNAEKYAPDYLPEVWQNITEEEKESGHGGMDGILFGEFLEALSEGREMPIDVYDAAAWMSISALSEKSVSMGGAPVDIPDFTNGKWLVREPKDVFPLNKTDRLGVKI